MGVGGISGGRVVCFDLNIMFLHTGTQQESHAASRAAERRVHSNVSVSLSSYCVHAMLKYIYSAQIIGKMCP